MKHRKRRKAKLKGPILINNLLEYQSSTDSLTHCQYEAQFISLFFKYYYLVSSNWAFLVAPW